MAALAACIVLASAQAAAAQVTIGSGATGGAVTLRADYPTMGERITPPNADPLARFSFWIAYDSAPFDLRPIIYEWDGASAAATVWTGPVTTITSATLTETVFTPNIALDPAKEYLLAVERMSAGEGLLDFGLDNFDPAGELVVFNGTTWSRQTTSELHYSATFGAPAPVPTLSQWAMILLGVTLAGGASLFLQRRLSV